MSLSFVLLRGRSTLKTTLVSGLTFPTHMNVWVEDMLNENLNAFKLFRFYSTTLTQWWKQ